MIYNGGSKENLKEGETVSGKNEELPLLAVSPWIMHNQYFAMINLNQKLQFFVYKVSLSLLVSLVVSIIIFQNDTRWEMGAHKSWLDTMNKCEQKGGIRDIQRIVWINEFMRINNSRDQNWFAWFLPGFRCKNAWFYSILLPLAPWLWLFQVALKTAIIKVSLFNYRLVFAKG